MIPNVALITKPAINFETFLGLSEQALGYSPSRTVDSSPIDYSDVDKYLSCLATLCGENEILPNLLAHVSFSVIVCADDRDVLDILRLANTAFVTVDTRVRGIQLVVMSGTLQQWKDAVKSGSSQRVEFNVRAFFNRVMAAFKDVGVDVWKDFNCRQLNDNTLLLEDKR